MKILPKIKWVIWWILWILFVHMLINLLALSIASIISGLGWRAVDPQSILISILTVVVAALIVKVWLKR